MKFKRMKEKLMSEAEMTSSSLKLQELIKERVGLEDSAKVLSGFLEDN